MILKESSLRRLIRRILFEQHADEKESKRDVLGEPDQTMEDLRDNPDDADKDEVSTVGALGASGTGPQPGGNLNGFVLPLGARPSKDLPVGMTGVKKKKKKKKARKK